MIGYWELHNTEMLVAGWWGEGGIRSGRGWKRENVRGKGRGIQQSSSVGL